MAIDIGVWGGLSSSIVPHVCPCQYHTAVIIVSLCEVLKSGSMNLVIICYRLTPTAYKKSASVHPFISHYVVANSILYIVKMFYNDL